MDKKKEIVIHSTSELNINLPEPNEYIKKEGQRTKDLVKSEGSYTPNGRVFIKKTALPHLLATDKKGGNKFFNDLEEEDILENGQDKYASVESVQKEASKRIQEPRDTIQKKRLKYTEQCLSAVRDAPEIEELRELEESTNRKELPKVKSKKRKAEQVDYVTGEKLTQPEVHHVERVADNPRKTLDENNLVVVNKDTHREIHNKGIESEDELSKFKNKKANK